MSNTRSRELGYISRFDSDGTLLDSQWITGLTNPKGIAVAGPSLYIATESTLVVADRETGVITAEFSATDVNFNDVAIAEDSTVYVTDLGNSAIWRLQDGVFEEFYTNPALGQANGIIVDGDRLIIADTRSGVIYQLDLTTQNLTEFADGFTRPDGVVQIDSSLFLISNFAGQIILFDERTGQYTVLLDSESAFDIADIGYDPATQTLYLPTFRDNGLMAYQVTMGDDTTTRPEPVADTYALTEDGSLTVDALAGVLANDSDPEGDPLTASVVEGTANGTLLLNDDGSFTYTPDADFFGEETFTYVASDGTSASTPVTVTLTVAGTPDAPRANAIADQEAGEAAAYDFTVPADALVDPDGDALTYTATLADGAALPAWLNFDPDTQTFSGSAPEGSSGTVLTVRVTGTDPDLQSAFVDFDITVTEAAPEPESPFQLLLIDPTTDTVVRTLSDTDTITPADIEGSYNLEAVYNGAAVGSVQFWRDGELLRTESGAPYAAYGDRRGDFREKTLPADGTTQVYEIKAFSGSRGSGEELASATFTIRYQDAPATLAPIIFDLNADGVYFSDTPVAFDFDSNGAREIGGWASAGDGILALDRNGNGLIDNGSEISFVDDLLGAKTDLEGLVAYDSNGDNVFSAADDDFDSFVIWTDRNSDCQSSADELSSLAEAGILGIDLLSNPNFTETGTPGAIVHGIAEVSIEGGASVTAADASLYYASDDDRDLLDSFWFL